MENEIRDALDQIRPFLQRDGGDIEFVEMKGHLFDPHPNVFIPLDLE